LAILVTGGTGANGSMVIRKLLEIGQTPVVYDLYPDTTLIKDIAERVKIVRGDILSLPNLIQAVKEHKIDRIIHLAAAIRSEHGRGNPAVEFKINCEGTLNVLETARVMDVKRIVLASSRAALGPPTGEFGYPTYKPVGEDVAKNPEGMYGATKLLCECMGLVYNSEYSLDFVVIRAPHLYGPGRSAHGGFAVIDMMVENALHGRPTKVLEGGDAKDDWTYTKDVAKGIVLACTAKKLQHHIFHIGTGKGTTLHDAAAIIKKIIPEAVIEVGPGYKMGPAYCSVLDISRARKELGYEPQYYLEDGIKDYINILRQGSL